MIRIAIYEDNKRYRESMEMLLSGHEDFTLSGAYPNANNIVQDLKDKPAEVLLMDIQMPGINGIHAVKKIKDIHPEILIIILTVFESNEFVFDALSAGANGYILKNNPSEKIIESIKDVINGGAPMSSTIAKKVLNFFFENATKNRPDYNLTVREKEVLHLLVKGYSYKMIAVECIISIDTVRSHIKKIYEKLQVNSNMAAVTKAISDRIV